MAFVHFWWGRTLQRHRKMQSFRRQNLHSNEFSRRSSWTTQKMQSFRRENLEWDAISGLTPPGKPNRSRTTREHGGVEGGGGPLGGWILASAEGGLGGGLLRGFERGGSSRRSHTPDPTRGSADISLSLSLSVCLSLSLSLSFSLSHFLCHVRQEDFRCGKKCTNSLLSSKL